MRLPLPWQLFQGTATSKVSVTWRVCQQLSHLCMTMVRDLQNTEVIHFSMTVPEICSNCSSCILGDFLKGMCCVNHNQFTKEQPTASTSG